MNIRSKLRNTFPALYHRNFQYFWFGQCISLIGTWMQNTGQSWLVLTLTNSPFLLGLVNALQFTPVLIFSLFSGVIIDRFSKKKILLFTQSAFAILALTLTLLVCTGKTKYWHVLILATLLGCISTIDMPTRQSFMIELVGKEDLMNAISLNSVVFNGAKIIGPAVSGIFINYFGMTLCFLINALSFIPVIYGITKIQVIEKKPSKKSDLTILSDIKDGLIYIKNKKILINVAFLAAVVSAFLMNFNVMIPLLSKDVLQKGSKEYGFLMSLMGLGSFIGALVQVMKSKKGPKKILLYISSISGSLILILVGLNKNIILDGILLLLVGFFNICFCTTANSEMQLNSSDEYRGRVMSVYSLVFGGLTPIGSLFSGILSNNIGVLPTFITSGVITLVFVFFIKYKNREKEYLLK
ncbi:MFS transporter [Hathewaya limosa]|uniref:MFS family permease n=1 Tax=Hathewaya limosa TaxID=1536 RepID=A0ABU0JTZ1_HATLI|nr:MFS transporter [Hathewaya limosa]MDQ0480571.1 MFS family permease [Hathewaya limosa]